MSLTLCCACCSLLPSCFCRAGPVAGGSSSEEQSQSEHKENREPPAKRQRKVLGGAAREALDVRSAGRTTAVYGP